MGLRVLSVDEARTACLEALGFVSDELKLDAPEALAAALRRAASFQSPTTTSRLVRQIENLYAGLLEEAAPLSEHLAQLVEALVSCGDLLELPTINGPDAGVQLYLGPPTFVRRRSGAYLLTGIRPDGVPLVGEQLSTSVAYKRHIRYLPSDRGQSTASLLSDYGLRDVSSDVWLRHPAMVLPGELIRRYDDRLDASGRAGFIEGLTLIDPTTNVTYYRGRWAAPTTAHTGRFVARRPQAYGAHLWCYAELADGTATRVLDLPIEGNLSRGCDEAWRLQAALDSAAGHPQLIRVHRRPEDGRGRISLLAPPPAWLQRRWDAIGDPCDASGALLAYDFELSELPEELDFASEMMWVEAADEQDGD